MEGIDVISITDLILKADIRWKEQAKKRKEHHDQLKAKMESALAEESGLHKEIVTEKKAVNLLQQEYFKLEKSVEAEAKKAVEKEQLTAADVESGKITLKQYQSHGVSEKKKADLIVEKILQELEHSLNLIRIKRKKILQKELKLSKLHRKIFRLSLFPGEILVKALTDQKLFINNEMNNLYSNVASADSNTNLLEHQLHLTEGKGLSAGHSWPRITLEQADKILFDPVLPAGLITDFKQQLQEFQDPEEFINVLLHSPPGKESSIEVQPAGGIGPRKQVIQTSKKNKSDRKNKSINTRDL